MHWCLVDERLIWEEDQVGRFVANLTTPAPFVPQSKLRKLVCSLQFSPLSTMVSWSQHIAVARLVAVDSQPTVVQLNLERFKAPGMLEDLPAKFALNMSYTSPSHASLITPWNNPFFLLPADRFPSWSKDQNVVPRQIRTSHNTEHSYLLLSALSSESIAICGRTHLASQRTSRSLRLQISTRTPRIIIILKLNSYR